MTVFVAMVDWSAASTPRPPRPSADACWLAYGWHGDPRRPRPEYFRTRAALLARLRGLLIEHEGPALLGVDFALGYPDPPPGVGPVLPSGRALARQLAARVVDEDAGRNNRFEVAADLNQAMSEAWGGPGPFWACPPAAVRPSLRPKKPTTPAPEWRVVEVALRAQGHRPHSVWKLYTTGAVGGQTLLGIAALGRWLDDPDLGPRIVLWPFDNGFRRPRRRRAIVVGEAWPTLTRLPPPGSGVWSIKDARQVAALRDAAMRQPDPWTPLARPSGLSPDAEAQARREGWLLGLPEIIALP